MQVVLTSIFWLGAALVLFTTLAPLTSSVRWWIRGWDFPRIHIAIVALFFALLGFALQGTLTVLTAAILTGCAIYQLVRIFPYTRLATPELTLRDDIPEDAQIKVIASNVLMENTDHDALIDTLTRNQPDILFLMETDQVWADALSDHLQSYSTVVSHPQDDHYGLIFATKLDVLSTKIVFLSDDTTPTILAELSGPGGPFFFVGLHPRPPVPGNSTRERDEQIKRAALLADRKTMPVIAMGDFNDVAWSYSSQRFKKYGEFRDPRVGRAMLPSFDANSWLMRFPIDQLYLTEGLELVSFDRLDPIGSDHFPMCAQFARLSNHKKT